MNSIQQKKVQDFLDEISSNSPTPGGGSVAAIVGAFAASLVEMVVNITRDKNIEIKRIGKRAMEIRVRLLKLADEDSKAFEEVMKAYKTSKEDKKRGEKIQKALKKATEVPLETALFSNELGKLAKIVLKKGNKNASSDAKVAIHLAKASVESALENVRINLLSLRNKDFIDQVKKSVKEIEKN